MKAKVVFTQGQGFAEIDFSGSFEELAARVVSHKYLLLNGAFIPADNILFIIEEAGGNFVLHKTGETVQ